MADIKEIQDEIIEEFAGFDDWLDRYQLLIDLGSEQEPLPEEYKTDNNLIEGCQSRVWLQADVVDGKVVFAPKYKLCALAKGTAHGHAPAREGYLIALVALADTVFSYARDPKGKGASGQGDNLLLSRPVQDTVECGDEAGHRSRYHRGGHRGVVKIDLP